MESAANDTTQKKGVSRNVVLLGWVSLFNDAASEMLYPIMPLFLTVTLGASPALLGLIDGTAEGVSSALRWVGGVLSDRFRKRKPFVLVGYILSAVSKPVMGLSAFVWGWPIFMVGRCTDRLGKSVRNAARDALIAASTDEESRGSAFGFQRAMDTCGAVIGPLVALGVIAAAVGGHAAFAAHWKGEGALSAGLRKLPLKWLFFVALVPGLLAVGCVMWVKEIAPGAGKKTKTGGKPPNIFQAYPKTLWRVMGAAFVFSLGNSSDTFLILRSSQIGLGFGVIILAYVMYNVIYAAGSEPLGRLSDRIGRKPLLVMGWGIYALVYGGFAVCKVTWGPWVLLGIYGLYQAMTDGVTGAMISDVVPDEKRAGAMGLYYTVVGLGQLAASVVGGALYNVFVFKGQVMLTFAIGAMCAAAAMPILMMVRLGKRGQS